MITRMLRMSFTSLNQSLGVAEDCLNKSDRPIPSGLVTVQGARRRWRIYTCIYLGLAYALGVLPYACLWSATTYVYNEMGGAKNAHVKNICMTFGYLSMLASAWKILEGTNDNTHVSFIIALPIVTFFGIAIQDLRDMKGDLLVGRETLPILWGEEKARLFLSLVTGFVIPCLMLLTNYYFPLMDGYIKENNFFLHVFTSNFMFLLLPMMLSIYTGFRILTKRDVAGDRLTYEIYVSFFFLWELSPFLFYL